FKKIGVLKERTEGAISLRCKRARAEARREYARLSRQLYKTYIDPKDAASLV
ncbi:unnamed protein product, partial [marine sediment metagenome]